MRGPSEAKLRKNGFTHLERKQGGIFLIEEKRHKDI